ncbi:MAG TPA: MFS transporter [Candidatus Paceibacterota bacterium]|nr:MFS transporter [Candidatus Paceibacterota bacterium]
MRISHTIRTLITSDFLINGGFSVFMPVFAVFVTKQIENGTVEVVGFAAAIAQIVKSVLQLPVARWLDRNHGEYDDFYSLIAGSSLVACTPFLYLFASQAIHVYLIQAIFGVGMALAVPPWYAIFTRHIDRMHENFEWSLESIAIGISGASSAALSGIVVAHYGFQTAFVIGGILTVLGAYTQTRIYYDLRKKVAPHGVSPKPDRAA